MRQRALAIVLAGGLAAMVVTARPSPAEARPGGGHSYSGGSSGGSSSGGGGSSSSSGSSHSYGSSSSGSGTSGGALPPGVFLVLFFGMFLFVGGTILKDVVGSRGDREARIAADRRYREYEAREARKDYVALIKEKDPEFSLALFEDFLRALFGRAHEARHDDGALARLAPYLSPGARKRLRSPEKADTVIIGAMRISSWNFDELRNRFVATVDFEANLVVGGTTHLVRETWTLERSPRAATRPWSGVRTFACPSCAAPLEQVTEQLCASCGQSIADGRFDWMLRTVELHQAVRTGTGLTGTVAEQGTDRPTVVHPELETRKAALLADDPAALTGFSERLHLIFSELNAAWAAQDLKPVRPYLSSGLFETMRQQVDTYRQQGLVNVVDGARIVRWEMVKLVRDARYDALTVRLFGSGRDYTYRKDGGELVGGDKHTERPYSEYWTLLRGAQARGAPRVDKLCPQCGAALSVGMEGNCEHCGALIASGAFDWVLGGIEQDDAYRG